ncbi:MAG: zf-HC2 domain-containing protein [Acidobacteriota bacterium]
MKNAKQINSQFDQAAQFGCHRQEDLVTYLYNEATPVERASFENHLNECDPCSAELNAFGRVRDELSTWQVGFTPRTELVLPRGKMHVLRELAGLFPAWARGLAVAGAATAVVLLALSIIGTRVNVNKGDFAISFGSYGNVEKGNELRSVAAPSQQEIEALVNKAIAAEREKMQQDYQAQFASFKQQLDAEHRAQLQAVSAEHQAKLEATKASLRQEIKKSNLQHSSIRSFFALGDDRQDQWSDVK